MSLKAIGDEELLDYVVEKDFEDTVARIILASVRSFNDGVGRVKLSRLLRGKDPGLVIRGGPEMSEFFGRLRILDGDQIMDFQESLVRLDLLDITDPEFPRLQLTRKGKQAMKSSRQIPAMIPWPLPAREIPLPVDRSAYDRLREERNRIAREEGLPPYCIASNISLVEIVNRGVSMIEDLPGVPGMGDTRARRYGEALLSSLTDV